MEKNYLEIARKYVYETIGEELESIEDYDDIFCFFYQSKKYLETLDFRDMLVGQGPQLIIKSDGRIIPFGSAYTSDTAIRETRKKILIEKTIRKVCPNYNYWYDNYVLIIDKVFNENKLISILKDHRATYIIPEVIGNSIYRVGKVYTKNDLIKRFQNPPASFSTFYGLYSELLIKLTESYCCNFSIKPKKNRKFASSVEYATEKDYETVW
ncbi:hypothetical protein GCM10023210_08920 [Chryseobacterium ginsengisoli]|uniref:Immunity protein 35 domain-containing protein n=1 Tax=Chryseobacterium ginsengisoli TaxID=363853 RepID=A0ABP9M024_9FLAO